jgi:hypothetical protein
MVLNMKNENITYLLGAYFHQDWFLEASEPDDIIKSFINRETSERVRALKQEINYLLANCNELSNNFIIDNNGYYDPRADGLTVHKWLQHTLTLLP